MRLLNLILVAFVALVLALPAVAEEGAQASPESAPIMAPDAASDSQDTVAAEPSEAAPETALGPVGYDEQGRPGRIHVVVSGDTLWDISEAYLGTPWIWPSVWRDNPDVANPHRIFPADRIWITPTEMRRLTPAEADAFLARGAPQEQLPAAVDNGAGNGVDAMPGSMRTHPVPGIEHFGFVQSDVFESAGAILGRPGQAKWLAQTRRVYMSQGEGEVQVGDRLAVARAVERVIDPETNREIGVYVDQLGWIEVTRVETESSEGVIRKSFREMQVGDRLLPHESMPTEVTILDIEADVAGQIAFFPANRSLTGHHDDLVFLNRGTDHGVEVGTPLVVFRPGDVAEDSETRRKHQLPDDVVADLLVVSAEPGTAVAIVTHSRTELNRGDRFRGATQ